MIINAIKTTIECNKIDLESIDGYRLYYSKLKSYISLIVLVVFIIFGLYLFAIETMESGRAVYGLGTSIFFTFFIQDPLSRILLKNPVFIVNKDKLYYLKTNSWYDLMDYDFDDEFLGANSGYTYWAFRIKDKEGNLIIEEKKWHLQDWDDLEKLIRYYKLMKKKSEK